ncbi:MAG: hypothetical protein V1859_02630 [archaeon]
MGYYYTAGYTAASSAIPQLVVPQPLYNTFAVQPGGTVDRLEPLERILQSTTLLESAPPVSPRVAADCNCSLWRRDSCNRFNMGMCD